MRRRNAMLANPVLVGAVTVLIVVIAVFLSYNANTGLPFVPTQSLRVLVPDGANLVRGNEVRTGGDRVGIIQDIKPIRHEDGTVVAELKLKLDERLGDVPSDSTVRIRPRSALGLKYLELTEGDSPRVFNDGDTIPLRGGAPVDLDHVLSTFDKPTRDASERNLEGFGDAFAARGGDLGRTIEELPGLTRVLEPVMRNLADPDTQLERFFSELGDAARIVAPIAQTQARLFTEMADTFEAFSRDEDALKATIEKSPDTLAVGTDSLRTQRPFLTDVALFSKDLEGAARELRGALPTVNRAIARGIPVQQRAVSLNTRLRATLAAVDDLVSAPGTRPAIRGVGGTVATLNPQLKFYGPFVTVCNSWNYFWTFAAEHFSELETTGEAQRALLNSAGHQTDSIGSMGAIAPANGDGKIDGNAQYAHNQPYAAAIDKNGNADCEAGQRGWLKRQAKFLPDRFDVAIDPQNPGNQGPTYKGREHVLPGQTFTSRPLTGPYATPLESEFP